MKQMPFNYFDIALVVWLIVGLFLGRKHGMSEELLPVVQWLLIIVVSSQCYSMLAQVITQNIPGYTQLWANITAYCSIAIVLKLIFSKIKTVMGEKLVGSDMFGRSEYYLGILAGIVRFACMFLCFCAVLNARIVTASERAATAKEMEKWAEGMKLPTYGSVQNGLLNESMSGRFIKNNLYDFLIRSVTKDDSKADKKDTPAKKSERDLDAVMGTQKK
jgi:uncharacterized membrane protein required for colicin V production